MYRKGAKDIYVSHMEVFERVGERKRTESCWTKLLVPFLRGPRIAAVLFPTQKPVFGELKSINLHNLPSKEKPYAG